MPELYASKFSVALDHPLPRALGAVEQSAIRFADAAIAVSQPCLERYAARGADPSRFTVVMNSADPALFPARASAPPADDVLRIVSHGTLTHRYGFDLIVEALDRIPRARLDILGEGEAREHISRRIGELGLSDRARLAGHVPLDRIAERLSAAHVAVVANRADPFTELVLPTKLLEYVAIGLPAVVARMPAVEAHFDETMVAWFQPGDPADLARALVDCARDPAAAAARADRARAVYEERYAWPVMARRYVGLVERLADRAT
jgi:glycosyltransferase involved in cell wall biosynthesis